MNYYNEIDPYACAWLRALIADGLIPDGHVDERDIRVIQPGDVAGFDQCHFFAGLGGWSRALHLAGWRDDEVCWTGSCPCQPFSNAGRGLGTADPRHLWPDWLRLIAECRPPVVFGEQVASKAGRGWLAGVRSDLEALAYGVGAADLCAASVGAPHIRQRLWFVADADGGLARDGDVQRGRQLGLQPEGCGVGVDVANATSGLLSQSLWGAQARDGVGSDSSVNVVDAESVGRGEGWAGDAVRQRGQTALAGSGVPVGVGDAGRAGLPLSESQDLRREGRRQEGRAVAQPSVWGNAEWLLCGDGKARRVEPGIRLLAHGVPARVAKLRALGNAIVPQVGAEFVAAYLDGVI